ncbi:GNAT family N-acetyltransferase [Actinoplanes sp. NEAU-A12]|uniref:GNAT family N-acetyltransferase n=1 Tax=Actinoplanes sandaracinus TaxID=3045177 RepID=A0ABT6WZI7_9ACTN|nr:GNAT family N-acetyltransferase [Actinoplanes sandaracinus]MDI6105158.1 GNAT family N-acetyltransferase [Actinoplanes sandaracinus]
MLFPHTASRRIRLRPATTTDRADFFQTVVRAGMGSSRQVARPTTRVAKPHAAFLVVLRSTDETIGFSTLHTLDPAGHIQCGVYLDPQRAKLGVGSETVQLTINYAFATLDVDKVITQTTEASFASFGVTTEDNQASRVQADHLYFRGQLWDQYGFHVDRQEWDDYVDRKADRVLPSPLEWRAAPHQHFGIR